MGMQTVNRLCQERYKNGGLASLNFFLSKPSNPFSYQWLDNIKLNMMGIWKVLSMVCYLSTQFTNPIIFGIILKKYLFSLLLHKFHEDVMMQLRKILL